jgi:hypothetical protein
MEQRVIIHRVGDFTASQVFFTASQVFYERLGWRCATEEVVFFQLGAIHLSLLPREAQAREADHPPEGSGFSGVLALTTRTADRVRGGHGRGAKRQSAYTQDNRDTTEADAMRTPMCAVFAMLLAIHVAHAQQAQSESPPDSPQPTTPIGGIDHAALAGSARASKLIGSKVYHGDISIGQIEDVLVDLNHANLIAVVLSVGGFLGVGDKLVAVPVTQIKVGSEAKFTTDLTREQMTAAPAFDFGKLQ